MPATRESMKEAQKLFDRIEGLNSARSEIERGSVTITFGDFGNASFRPRGADFTSTIREGAAADIAAQISEARQSLAALGFEA